jgi:hypothetical protein
MFSSSIASPSASALASQPILASKFPASAPFLEAPMFKSSVQQPVKHE